jgi:ubiquinone/menaquinone biosynthesis C-methylase UbiE
MIKLIDRWNQSHSRIPNNKSESNYAVEREKLFPRNSHVLDLGGGSGTDAVYFAKHGHTVTVADISDVGLTRAKEKAKNEGVELSTAQVELGQQPLPFPPNFFDIVFSRLAIHYFQPKETTEILKNIYEVLKPSGITYIVVKSPDDKEEMDFLLATANQISENVFEDNGEIKSRYTKEQLSEFIKNAGIENFEVKEYVEDLSGRVDSVKSGNSRFILNEIILRK